MSLYLGKERINNVTIGDTALGITNISDETTISIEGILKGEDNKIVTATPNVDYITPNDLNLKANINSPEFTGIPLAPTPSININNTQIATTEFVNLLIENKISTILNKAY